jgi:hypothetical protein
MEIVTIKGVPVIDIYESFDDSYWFITEKLYRQDSVIDGKVYKNDQILCGYVMLAACPEYAEWGNVSKTELDLLSPMAWKVPKSNWPVCPQVKVENRDQDAKAEERADENQPDPAGQNVEGP